MTELINMKEVKEARAEMLSAIIKAVEEFNSKTGLYVTGMDYRLYHASTMQGAQIPYSCDLDVTVELIK